jgi:hypothetical protein
LQLSNGPCTKYIYIKSTTVYVPSSELGLSQLAPNPSLASECAPPPGTKGEGVHSPTGVGMGESQFRRLEKSIALCLLCGSVGPTALAKTAPARSGGGGPESGGVLEEEVRMTRLSAAGLWLAAARWFTGYIQTGSRLKSIARNIVSSMQEPVGREQHFIHGRGRTAVADGRVWPNSWKACCQRFFA